MRTAKFILLLVVFSVVPSLATLGQDDALPFMHTACASGVDLTGQTVTLYHIINPEDQVETVYNPIRVGYTDAAEYFNAHGGICGATLVQGFGDRGKTNTEWLYYHFAALNPKPVLVTIYGSGDGVNLADQMAQDQIPALNLRGGSTATAYGKDGKTLGWDFLTNPIYADQMGAMCDYIMANPQRFPKPVIGYITFDASYAATPTAQGRSYCTSLGIGDAGIATFNNESTNIDKEIQKLIDGGANIIFTNSHERGPILVAKTLAKMGLKGKVPLVGGNMDPYEAMWGEKDLDSNGIPDISGMIGSIPVRTWSEQDNPGIQLITEQADLHQRPPTMRVSGYIIGWDTTDLFIEVYIQTGNRVGFDHITGEEIKTTLENIVYQPLSGVERIDYQGGKRRALAETRIGEMDYLGKDGKTPASASNPPMVVQEGDQQHLVPMIIPLTDYQPAPDLRLNNMILPTGGDTSSAAPTATTVASTTSGANNGQIVFEAKSGGGDPTSEIYAMNADGSNEIQLTHNEVFDGMPNWSPDGSKIAFISTRDGNGEVYVMNADGSNPVNLSNNPANEEMPMWSPDGKKIVFNTDRDGNSESYVMNADGSNQTNLTNNKAFDNFPHWSPDGTKLLFTSDRDGNQDIYIMNADGSHVSQVTDTLVGDNYFPIWSPDGSKIMFDSTRDGQTDIFVMNADGSNPVNLTNGKVHGPDQPAWSPDGTKILLSSDLNGNWDFYVMNADGSNLVNLTNKSLLQEAWTTSWKAN